MKIEGRSFGYTIYKNPSDVPGHYVLRGWDIEDGKTIHSQEAIATPIDDIALRVLRATMVEMGLTCLNRSPEDDPVILETWI